ncbi:hypothetical protein JK635_08165 [Neobacillus sp. YIM B02564]|uniref:Uncharacterized protein n=1 Tax=Neobacillus paridis TaxID=2803862 RepID=A0ABS1TLJ1_9BACI|nr:hypothetical protein [Neobacillus paridis]MBL4952186.1 hypothetical protein [Neobacillus paridis]
MILKIIVLLAGLGMLLATFLWLEEQKRQKQLEEKLKTFFMQKHISAQNMPHEYPKDQQPSEQPKRKSMKVPTLNQMLDTFDQPEVLAMQESGFSSFERKMNGDIVTFPSRHFFHPKDPVYNQFLMDASDDFQGQYH